MVMEEKTLTSTYVFRGRVVTLRVDEVEVAPGTVATREVVEHPGAVGIVGITEKGEVVLIRQFRKAVDEILWEIPAGKLDLGEAPMACARRELAEETGFYSDNLRSIGSFYTSPGFSGEILHLFLARDLIPGKQTLEDDENITMHLVPYHEALRMQVEGKIKDGKTIAGLLLVKPLLEGGEL